MVQSGGIISQAHNWAHHSITNLPVHLANLLLHTSHHQLQTKTIGKQSGSEKKPLWQMIPRTGRKRDSNRKAGHQSSKMVIHSGGRKPANIWSPLGLGNSGLSDWEMISRSHQSGKEDNMGFHPWATQQLLRIFKRSELFQCKLNAPPHPRCKKKKDEPYAPRLTSQKSDCVGLSSSDQIWCCDERLHHVQ